MLDKDLKLKINKTFNFGEVFKKARKIAIDFRISDGYSEFDFYKNDYSLKEINDFLKENKKLLFKKAKKFTDELNNNWSKIKYEKLVNMIICKKLLKKENINDILNELGIIIKKLEYNNQKDEGLDDKTIVNNSKENIDIDYENISKEFNELGFKNFVYKHIIPNAILNDEKGHFYTSTELEYIADLRYNQKELQDFEVEYNGMININFNELTLKQIRKVIKRRAELTIILFFIADIKLRPDYIKPFIETYDMVLKIENPSFAGLYLYSYSSILYSMAYGKDDFKIDYQGILSPFCYIDNVKALLIMLEN